MLINEVENIVGLSKKSIRLYEENGLLSPKRNKNNDYRVYDDNDIKTLKVIKFLRELDVPIRDLKLLNSGELSLKECMQDRIKKIEEQENNYKKIKNMCLEISKTNESFLSFNVDKYFKEIIILNKKGFTMRNLKTSKSKKISGAILSSFLFISFFSFLIGLITYFQMTEEDKMPWVLYGFFVVLLCFPIFGIIYNLIIRIKEINGGEEDEASKY